MCRSPYKWILLKSEYIAAGSITTTGFGVGGDAYSDTDVVGVVHIDIGIVNGSHGNGDGSRVFYVREKNLLVTYSVCVKFSRYSFKISIVVMFSSVDL